MADDFFKKQEEKKEETTVPEEIQEPEKVKVGEKDYSQDELASLVGLGETAKDFETKWNRPIGQFYPDYTQKSQRLAELEKAEEERQKAELAQKEAEGSLSPEETRKVAMAQAKELGIVTKDEFEPAVNQAVANALAASKLVEDTATILAEAQEKGQPKATVQELLVYMEENGVRTPEAAYKLKFEPELDEWKEAQLNGLKPEGMETQEGSTAGAKTPPPPPAITKENLSQAIQESLTRGRGVQ